MAKLATTWEQVCKKQGINPSDLPVITGVEERFKKYMIASWKVMNIFEALNGKNWRADYSNTNQEKWRPWFIWDASLSAFRFHIAYIEFEFAFTGTGVRYVGKTKPIAEHAAKYFIDIFNEMLQAQP